MSNSNPAIYRGFEELNISTFKRSKTLRRFKRFVLNDKLSSIERCLPLGKKIYLRESRQRCGERVTTLTRWDQTKPPVCKCYLPQVANECGHHEDRRQEVGSSYNAGDLKKKQSELMKGLVKSSEWMKKCGASRRLRFASGRQVGWVFTMWTSKATSKGNFSRSEKRSSSNRWHRWIRQCECRKIFALSSARLESEPQCSIDLESQESRSLAERKEIRLNQRYDSRNEIPFFNNKNY